ncbi:DUF6807 domain-containing protein [Stieleria varia]|uniref:Methane oxygenase PmoA n=1 Tax=Stieleria varia TaxID=2528005 RepID=A0A5C6B3H9_9BACT|nr:PmoA family protein [Stieleria varia]TWU06488.1 hypothetical protein Pla52n_22100 [Stieleria varia]
MRHQCISTPFISSFALLCGSLLAATSPLAAQQYIPPRCEIIPQANHEVSLRIDGVEKLRWNHDSRYPRPFLFPLNGPRGEPLTRMGHPGAPDHEHHRSVWFAHHKVNGLTFWSDNTQTRIRQTQWYRYRDGDDEAIMAVALSWEDADGVQLMQQDVVISLFPLDDPETAIDEHAVEFYLTFRPGQGRENVTLEKTNFGVLAVRVAKSISAYFGDGRLTNDVGTQDEKNLHEKPARWMDYSGPVALPPIASGAGRDRQVIQEGITFFDHPGNPSYPTHWHVRQDGWMGAAPTMQFDIVITNEKPLTLRYLLHAHHGTMDLQRAEQLHEQFASRPGFRIRKPVAGESHRHFEVERLEK